MKIVGLTGGIGSGKTTVSKCFGQLGIPVFYADTVAKDLYNSPAVVDQIKKILEVDNIHLENGKLDRNLIANIIFKDQKKLEDVNGLLHPLVKEEFFKWMDKQNSPYCIREAAILIESGSYKDCDFIIVVTADMEVRIKRVMQRDGVGESEVRDRIMKQLSDEERLRYADYIIQNNGSADDLQLQVNEIHKKLL
jgi:dephospho-CoA kinase